MMVVQKSLIRATLPIHVGATTLSNRKNCWARWG
ncbi:hypothetical protein CIPAW_01G214300 [Carya illinoinensis]|uniref:Uncharacterized protein n=1 Tax=Carya illinoinensis TaxID=32201 RepID=A0A8T1RSX2_CARIL|nr:hypothetical protein CIPAW_01G214300 [Carya illinoinensis]